MPRATLHGLTLDLPEGSIDQSIYRFVLPAAPSGLQVPALAARAPKQGPEFRPSLILAPCAEALTLGPGALFRRNNDALGRHDPTFKVLAASESWQDSTLAGPNGMRLFQRLLVWKDAPLLVTLTSDSSDLQALAASLGLCC